MFDFDLNVIERLFFFILLKSPHDVTQILSRRNWVIEYFHFTVLMFTFSLFPLNSLDRLNNYDEFFRFSMPRPTSAFTFLDHKYSERIWESVLGLKTWRNERKCWDWGSSSGTVSFCPLPPRSFISFIFGLPVIFCLKNLKTSHFNMTDSTWKTQYDRLNMTDSTWQTQYDRVNMTH